MSAENESPLARDATYQDLVGTTDEYHSPTILWATAGWDGEASVEDLGGTDNDGRTLARVTLNRGKKAGATPTPGRAQGHPVLVQVVGPLFAIPPAGTQVLCVFPEGDTVTPGNGAIVGWAQSSPTSQFKSSRAVLDMGVTMDLVLKGRSVTLMDHGKEESPARFNCWLTLGPVAGGAPTISCNDPTGSGFTIGGGVVGIFATDNGSPPAAKTVLQLAASGFGLVANGSGLIKCDTSGNITVGCGSKLALVGGQIALGAAATAISPILYGPSGLAGVPSTCVFVSP